MAWSRPGSRRMVAAAVFGLCLRGSRAEGLSELAASALGWTDAGVGLLRPRRHGAQGVAVCSNPRQTCTQHPLSTLAHCARAWEFPPSRAAGVGAGCIWLPLPCSDCYRAQDALSSPTSIPTCLHPSAHISHARAARAPSVRPADSLRLSKRSSQAAQACLRPTASPC